MRSFVISRDTIYYGGLVLLLLFLYLMWPSACKERRDVKNECGVF